MFASSIRVEMMLLLSIRESRCEGAYHEGGRVACTDNYRVKRLGAS